MRVTISNCGVHPKWPQTKMARSENGHTYHSHDENGHKSDQNGHNVKLVENQVAREYSFFICIHSLMLWNFKEMQLLVY